MLKKSQRLLAIWLSRLQPGWSVRIDRAGLVEPDFSPHVAVTHSAHSMRKALTGSIEAARRAGMIPAMAAASVSTPMATVITGAFTLVIS
jgi:hypothetical protein